MIPLKGAPRIKTKRHKIVEDYVCINASSGRVVTSNKLILEIAKEITNGSSKERKIKANLKRKGV
jgi:hypothetical protein